MEFTKEEMEKIRKQKYSNISKFEYDEKNKLLFVESIKEGVNKSIEIYTTHNSMQKGVFYPNHPKLLFRHDKHEIFQKDLEELLTEKYGIKPEEVIQLQNEYSMYDRFAKQYVATQAFWEKESIIMARLDKKFEAERKALVVSDEKMRKRFTI